MSELETTFGDDGLMIRVYYEADSENDWYPDINHVVFIDQIRPGIIGKRLNINDRNEKAIERIVWRHIQEEQEASELERALQREIDRYDDYFIESMRGR